jgi:hypothetical protein
MDRQSRSRLRADPVSRRLLQPRYVISSFSNARSPKPASILATSAASCSKRFKAGNAGFAPVEYMRALRHWTERHNALLVCDEVQAAFGRTGTMWGFEHYGIVPDLAASAKASAVHFRFPRSPAART